MIKGTIQLPFCIFIKLVFNFFFFNFLAHAVKPLNIT